MQKDQASCWPTVLQNLLLLAQKGCGRLCHEEGEAETAAHLSCTVPALLMVQLQEPGQARDRQRSAQAGRLTEALESKSSRFFATEHLGEDHEGP